MFVRNKLIQVIARPNFDRDLRFLHKASVLTQSERLPVRENLPEISRENGVLPAKRGPVPQKLLHRIKVEYHGVGSAKFNDETLWVPFYRYPHIGKIHAIIRFKVYLTGLSIFACMRNVYHLLGAIDPNLIAATMLSSTTVIGMVIAGNFFRKLIVQIYVSEDLTHLRICRFTFFGKRRDMVLPTENVLPLSETNRGRRKLFFTVKTTMPEDIDLSHDFYEFYDEEFTIILRHGGILDMRTFEKIMGTILRMKMGTG